MENQAHEGERLLLLVRRSKMLNPDNASRLAQHAAALKAHLLYCKTPRRRMQVLSRLAGVYERLVRGWGIKKAATRMGAAQI
jgi:hypothetical protein